MIMKNARQFSKNEKFQIQIVVEIDEKRLEDCERVEIVSFESIQQ